MRTRGFVLLPVLCFILVIALLAYGASRSGPAAVAQLASSDAAASARYAAEAGVAHASWAAEQSNCGNYSDLGEQSIGDARYDVSYSAPNGSPVTVHANGSLTNGASYSLARTIDVYQLPKTMEDQPDAQNSDTFIRKGDNNSHGSSGKLEIWTKASDEARALLQVNLSSIPGGARVVSAVLQIAAEAEHVLSGAAEVTAHRLTRAWSETNASWVNYDVVLVLGQPWTTAGGDYDATPAARVAMDGSKGWKSLDVTVLVQRWIAGEVPNYGLLLKANSAVNDFKIYSSDEGTASRRPMLVIQYVCRCGSTCAPVVKPGTTLVLSTRDDGTLAGTTFSDGDLVRYDPVAATASVLLSEADLFDADEDVDALQVYDDGRILLSTATAARVAGLPVEDEDLVEYNPGGKTATLEFDGSAHFAGDENVNAAYAYADGRIMLSTQSGASLAGLAFGDDDLVEYNPMTNAATLIFDGGAHFSGDENIDAVQMLDDGRFLLSTDSDATLGGLSFSDADVVLYDPLEDKATRVYDGSTLTSSPDSDVDGVHDFRPHPLVDELRLEPIADTYLNSASPGTPFGSAGSLVIGNTTRSMLTFDLAALPAGATVTSATLYLNLSTTSGSSLSTGAYKVTAAWAEGTATWSNTGGGTFDALAVATATFSSTPAKWVKWSLPPTLIQEWRDGVSPNYGVLLKPTLVALATTAARSRNFSSTALHPRLVIKYTP